MRWKKKLIYSSLPLHIIVQKTFRIKILSVYMRIVYWFQSQRYFLAFSYISRFIVVCIVCICDGGYICLSPNCVRIDEHEECLFSTQKIVFVDFCILFYFSWKKASQKCRFFGSARFHKICLGYVPFVYCYIHLKPGITSVHLSRDRARCVYAFVQNVEFTGSGEATLFLHLGLC